MVDMMDMQDETTKYIQNVIKNNLRKTNESITSVNVRIKTLQQGLERDTRLKNLTNDDLLIDLGNEWSTLARLLKARAYFEARIAEFDKD